MGLPNVLNDDCDATRFPQRLHKHTKVSAFGQRMTLNNSIGGDGGIGCDGDIGGDGGIADSAPEVKQILLASGCLSALIIGTYLSWNVLWHLKVKFFHCEKDTNEISVFPKVIKFWSHISYPNMFGFQIANKSRGRGVQRLLLLAHRINLLGIPALALLVFQAADPPESMGYITCFLVRMVTIILGTNRMLSEPTVALGRYVNLS